MYYTSGSELSGVLACMVAASHTQYQRFWSRARAVDHVMCLPSHTMAFSSSTTFDSSRLCIPKPLSMYSSVASTIACTISHVDDLPRGIVVGVHSEGASSGASLLWDMTCVKNRSAVCKIHCEFFNYCFIQSP